MNTYVSNAKHDGGRSVLLENTVAVIIPCYNAATTLAATIESAIGQPGVSEIVAIDDGSTDDTLAILRSYEPHIRIFTGSNAGVSVARNRGIAETHAPWLLFLDSDDLLLPGTIERRLDVARSTSADVVISDWRDIIDDGAGTLHEGDRRAVDWAALVADPVLATAVHVWATTAAILYSRTIVQRIGGFRADLPVIQDARFLYDAAFQGAHFAHSEHVGAQYRVLSNSLSRANPVRFWGDVLTNGQLIEQEWKSRGYEQEAYKLALYGIYNCAARGLFEVASPRYFDAVDAQRRLGRAPTRHGRIATPLAKLLGLKAARALLQPFTKK